MLRTAAVQNRPFAVALLDWSMPGTDGLELTNAIAVDEALTARLVHMTALGHEDDIGGVGQQGTSASLPKPLHREDLRKALRVALGLQHADVGSPPGGSPRLRRRPTVPRWVICFWPKTI
jgi:two-component system sensor histidine kinase/response regulator